MRLSVPIILGHISSVQNVVFHPVYVARLNHVKELHPGKNLQSL